MKTFRGFFDSSNGINRTAYYIALPDGRPKCIIQLAHGMCENALLYKGFMRFMAERGCVVCANDFLGHGKSVRSYDDVGFFAPKNGWRCIIRDMKFLTDRVRAKFPDLPVILVGHSMGSFAAREYLTWYGDILAGCVLVGTSDGFESRGFLKALAQSLCLYEDGRYHAPFVMKAGCTIFSAGTAENKDKSIWAWLTRDEYVRDLVARHSFDYTARAYCDIITLLDVISAPDWAYSVPMGLPILLMSGNCDAVGECGKGVAKLYRRLKRAGCKNIKVRLYGGARHMLLHETNRMRVYADLYDWIKKITERTEENEKTVS